MDASVDTRSGMKETEAKGLDKGRAGIITRNLLLPLRQSLFLTNHSS